MMAEKDLIRDVIEAYGSLSSPNFSFVVDRYRSHPHAMVIDGLQEQFDVEETTDLNDDVAVVLRVSGAEGMGGLLLSLVGDYAAATSEEGTLLERLEDDRVALLLRRGGTTFLSGSFLIRELEFGGEAKTLYEVLFSADGGERRERA